MRYTRTCAALLGSACILLSAESLVAQQQQTADVPRQISYQGAITLTDGRPVADGNHTVDVILYGDEAGTQSIWADSYTVPTVGGVFSIYLGSGSRPLPLPSSMNRPLWIGIRVDGAAELRPLTPLSAAPYALNLPDGAVTAQKLAAGAVTAEKMGAPYVSEIQVNGETISGSGTPVNIVGGKDVDVAFDRSSGRIVIGRQSPAASAGGKQGDGADLQAASGTGSDFLWSTTGDGWQDNVGAYDPTNTDWIGTSSGGGGANFTVKVNGERVMMYQPNGGSTPNIVGGYKQNVITATNIGSNIDGGGDFNFINQILAGSDYSSITGGIANTERGAFAAAIGGGQSNTIDTTSFAVIDGGYGNHISTRGWASVIGGGFGNAVDTLAEYSTISGGLSNRIYHISMHHTIGGGSGNRILQGTAATGRSAASTIGGGANNQIGVLVQQSTIAGGAANRINGQSDFTAIGGGANNSVDTLADYAVISGGRLNRIDTLSDYVTISGGYQNRVRANADYNTIGGGQSNLADIGAVNATIGGGVSNRVVGDHATIAGGRSNTATANTATVGGGTGNRSVGIVTTIAGGNANLAWNVGSTVGGGSGNLDSSLYGTIAGGNQNVIYSGSVTSAIGGGYNNRIDSGYYMVIGGGADNLINKGALHATIGGGIANLIQAGTPAATGSQATIPGGEFLRAKSYGQIVMGVWNQPKGNVPYRYGGTLPDTTDAPLLIIGNGKAPSRSNAFEVSYSGHSTVYDELGSTRAVKRGSTYTDNIVYAWGDMGFGGAANCSFGVVSVVPQPKVGWYRIRLNMVDPDGLPITLDCASITATISSGITADLEHGDPICKFIRVSRINPLTNEFDIVISQLQSPTGALECVNVDSPFMFKVTGRPRPGPATRTESVDPGTGTSSPNGPGSGSALD